MDRLQVDVFFADTTKTDFEALLTEYKEQLEQDRIVRIERANNPGRKKELAAAGVLLHKVLKMYGRKSKDVLLTKEGKPYLKDDELCFNISHSGSMVMLAVSEDQIGADIQKAVECKASLYERITSDAEKNQEELKDLKRLWAAKEGYSKLTGKGISVDFSTITVIEKETDFCIYDGNELKAYGKRVYEDENYAAIVCMEEPFDVRKTETISL